MQQAVEESEHRRAVLGHRGLAGQALIAAVMVEAAHQRRQVLRMLAHHGVVHRGRTEQLATPALLRRFQAQQRDRVGAVVVEVQVRGAVIAARLYVEALALVGDLQDVLALAVLQCDAAEVTAQAAVRERHLSLAHAVEREAREHRETWAAFEFAIQRTEQRRAQRQWKISGRDVLGCDTARGGRAGRGDDLLAHRVVQAVHPAAVVRVVGPDPGSRILDHGARLDGRLKVLLACVHAKPPDGMASPPEC